MDTAETSSSPRNAQLVQRFDVLQFVDEAVVPGIDFVVGECVEHERIVGVGGVSDANELLWHERNP